jgi:hypothetical protein
MRGRGDVMRWALLVLVSCGGSGGFPDAAEPTPMPPGSFAVDWSLANGSGQAVTCTQVGATTVLVAITAQPSAMHSSVAFECDLGGAVSGALDPGTYDLMFTLDAGSASLASAAPQTGIAIESDMTTRITPVMFALP